MNPSGFIILCSRPNVFYTLIPGLFTVLEDQDFLEYLRGYLISVWSLSALTGILSVLFDHY